MSQSRTVRSSPAETTTSRSPTRPSATAFTALVWPREWLAYLLVAFDVPEPDGAIVSAGDDHVTLPDAPQRHRQDPAGVAGQWPA